MKRTALLPALLCLLLPAWGQNPYVSFNPPAHVFNIEAGNQVSQSVKVQMTNTGNPFSFVNSSNQGWLGVSPTGGTIANGQTLELTVTANPTQMQSGTYTGIITVTPSAGSGLPPATFNVTMNISGLVIFVNPERLDFSANMEGTDTKSFSVSFSDAVIREIQVTPVQGASWLTVVSTPPLIAPIGVTVRAIASGLDPGTVLNGELKITVPSLPGVTKSVPASLTVLDQNSGFLVAPSQLNFYSFGTLPPPSQPVQVSAARGGIEVFDVVLSPDSVGLTATATRAQTPTTFAVQMDTTQVIQLPRQDTVSVRPSSGNAEIIIPVKTNSTPQPPTYAIPQVADGGPASAGKFRTSITVTNSDTSPVTVSLRFYKSDPATRATVPWTPQMENNEKIDNITIPVGASWTVQTAGAPDIISAGWAEVVCSSCTGNSKGVSGLAVFRQLQPDGKIQEAAVPINSTLMQRSLLPYDNTNGFVTSMAVANLSTTETARVRVAFRDANGKLLRIDKFKDIPARGHYSFELPREFPTLAGQRGTADIWILNGNISLLGLRFSPTGAFTSFEAQSFHRRLLGKRSLPQIADGGEFRTSITLVNNDSTLANVRLRFWQDNGAGGATTPWTVSFTNGANPDNLTIPPGTSITLETNGASPTTVAGWAEVITDQWVTGFAVFRQSVPGRVAQEAAVPVNTGTSLRYYLPFDNTGGFTTSVALANLNAANEAQVNFTFRDGQGLRILQAALPNLPASGHRAFRIIDLWPELDGKRGTLEVSSLSGEVTLMGLRFLATGAFTSFKAQPIQ
ncbi:MAG: hypothetical protein HY821_04225 [Acidobacteria bacterium]|nr:hypothetical protein [Acidobacteriota bacterium]